MGKKRIIRKYELLDKSLLQLVRQAYPDGFEDSLISFQTPTGELALALPLETEEVSYLIKMPLNNLPEEDDFDTSSGSSDSEFDNFESLDVAEDVAEDATEDTAEENDD